ncbi:S8 family peptidase [Planosporangium thailandense]|uniref:S8 family peptidase n=1 Tax=Planosporangium thailandense TaxID=765197 RepID=UPI001F0FAC66|nr:S8 family peptidase [Planosporangium thailandense]
MRRHEALLGGLSAAAVVATVVLMGSANAATTAGTATSGTATATGEIRGAGAPDAVRGSYIVVFKDDMVPSTAVDTMARSMVARRGGAVRQTWAAAVHGFELRAGAQTARQIAADPRVAYVEQNRILRISATQNNPPAFGLDRVDQRNLPLDGKFTAPTTASNVNAYIIDSGIRVSHVDFGGRASFVFNAVGDGINTDCNGHGTHVAGTVGGSTFGLAKQVRLFAVKVVDCNGAGDVASIVNGVNFVTRNAVKPAVANMSLGGGASATIDRAVNASIASGVTYAIAAGNENQNACNDSPARVPAAITVGATDQNDARANFSNFGACVDIFAPGVNIRSDFASADNATQVLSGTSMATPHVTGAAALVLGLHPNFAPQQVRDTLVTNATQNAVANAGPGSPTGLLFVAQK